MDVVKYLGAVYQSEEYSRSNQFSASIFPPLSVQVDNRTLERVSMNCHATNLPGRKIMTFDHSPGGMPAATFPHSFQYPDLNCNFYLSKDMSEKDLFDAWQKSIIDPVSGTIGYYDKYVGSIELAPLDRNDRVLGKYIFYEAWPFNVGDVEYKYSVEGAIATLSVSFKYKEWDRAREEEGIE